MLLVSRSHRQSRELFRLVIEYYQCLGGPMRQRQTVEELSLSNGSRIVCLPCKEETIRGYAHISLLILDEAARVPDDLYRAVRPMLAVSAGRLICLSTPYGPRGFFHDAWVNGGDDWQRIEVPAEKISRITPAFLASERRGAGRVVVSPGVLLLVRGDRGAGVSGLRSLCGDGTGPERRPAGGRDRLRLSQSLRRVVGHGGSRRRVVADGGALPAAEAADVSRRRSCRVA